jgi:signal transduction histidine kinase
MLLASIFLVTVFALDEIDERRHHGGHAFHNIEELVNIVLWTAIPAAVLGLGGGWWLMRKALAPVTTLTEAARLVNERNLKEELPRTRNGDELDRLTEVLNAMIARLNDSFSRVREFTLHASHELKTPLTVLSGETETELRDETLGAEDRERIASRLDELRRLTRIVDGLTLLARADAGLVPLSFNPVRLDDVVRDIFADTQILAEASSLSVQLPVCESITVRGDAQRLRQLLLNLSDNAVKYNQPRGSITMTLHEAAGTAEFAMANTGAGIPPEALPRVFDRFFRVDAAHGHEVEGCGLGLTIAQWIVSAHHGTIKVESAPAKQTTVTVRLPLARDGQPG